MSRLRRFWDQWRADFNFRTFLGAGGAFLSSVFFAVYNAYLGLHHRSLWNGSISVYYLLLSVIRGLLILTEDRLYRRAPAGASALQRRTFYASSAALILLNLALVVPVTLLALHQTPADLGLVPAIVLAAYTVYKVTLASINYRRKNNSSNVFVHELRTIALIDAVVSVLTLQNTLILVNHAGEEQSMLVLTSVTSAVLLVQILVFSVISFVRGRRMLSADLCPPPPEQEDQV